MLGQLSGRRRVSYRRVDVGEASVPKGYVPVMVGKEMNDGDGGAKFLIHVDMFRNESFAGLLDMVAQEVGYQNPGILTIPCDAESFRNLLNHIISSQATLIN